MKIKIDAVAGISLTDQLEIVSDFIGHNKKPHITKKDYGHGSMHNINIIIGERVKSCGRIYHVACHHTKTMWVFKIWWAI